MISPAGLVLLALVAAVAYVARVVAASWRLRAIPGPFLARYTDAWRFRAMRSPGWSARLIALHNQHGRLVRLGPNHVSVSDPAAIPIVYTTSPVWVKGPSYYAAATVSKGRTVPSIIAMDETQHTAVRKSAGRAFTTNSLLDYEASIDAATAELVASVGLAADAAADGKTDMATQLQCFAMDVLMRMAFSESLGFIHKGTDVDGILAAVVARFDNWNAWAALPGLDYLWNKSALATKLIHRRRGDSPLARVSMAQLVARQRQRQGEGKPMMDEEAAAKSNDLLQKFLDGQARYPDIAASDTHVLGIIMSTIGAGADTTAGTLAYTLYLLARHPAAAATLQAELDAAHTDAALAVPPRWTQVQHLPYLDAVLRESMRILPIASWGLDRVVPPAGATISGTFIPGGTVVGCQIDSIHLDKDVFGDDAAVFRPERWLEAEEGQRKRMDRAFLAFSAGKRTCTGIHIAWLEMKKTLPLLLMHFEVRKPKNQARRSQGSRPANMPDVSRQPRPGRARPVPHQRRQVPAPDLDACPSASAGRPPAAVTRRRGRVALAQMPTVNFVSIRTRARKDGRKRE